MELIKIVMIGIVTVLLAMEVKAYKPALGTLLGLAGTVLIIILSLDRVLLVLEQIKSVFSYLGTGAEYFMILVKVLGVTYLCQFASGICKDAGFGSLAEQIQVFGKLYVMLSGMPILFAFIEILQKL